MPGEKCIHVAFAFDQNFVTPFFVVLTSLFDNNKNNKIVLHVIAKIANDDKQKITGFVHQNQNQIVFYEIDETQLSGISLPEKMHFSIATYYRLFLPKLIDKKIKKILYLDTDIIIKGDLRDLYETDVASTPVAAAIDGRIVFRPDLNIYHEEDYFNAGVLLINTEQWQNQNITEKVFGFINAFPEKLQMVDQDALNAVLVHNWTRIDKKYNLTFYDIPEFLPQKKLDAFIKDVVIVHYTTQNKPWLIACRNRFRYWYHYYQKKSPYQASTPYVDLGFINLLDYLKVKIKEFLIDHGIKKGRY